MKVSEAIRILQTLPAEEHIILAFWERDFFPDVPAEEWPDVADMAECETDWSRAYEDIEFAINK